MNFFRLIKFTAAYGMVAGVISVIGHCEEVTTPKPPVGYGTMVEEKLVVRATTGGSWCSLHQQQVEYRFGVSAGMVNPLTDGMLFTSQWNGATQTLVISLPPIFKEESLLIFYLYAQARCARNRQVVSSWSEPAYIRILPGQVEKYVPGPEEVNLKVINVRGRINAWLTINFPDSGFAVLDWGIPERTASGFVVNAQIIRWIGITLPVISPWRHRYNLGFLSPGEYEFEFRTWGEPVKVFRFKVGSVPIDINQDSQFSVADLVVLAKVVSNSPAVIFGQVYQSPYPSWLVETCDINGDGQVDITDLILAISASVITTE